MSRRKFFTGVLGAAILLWLGLADARPASGFNAAKPGCLAQFPQLRRQPGLDVGFVLSHAA